MALLNARHIQEYQTVCRNALIDSDASLVSSSLASTCVPFDHIVTYDEVDSTNLRVKDALNRPDYDGWPCVHTALVQTHGYGRQGRSWTSPLGGLYASLGIDLAQFIPTPLRTDVSTLSLVAGLSVKAALEQESDCAAQDIQIKWPNDVLVNDAKICGISLELFNSTMLCMGVGINVVRDERAYENTPSETKYQYAYACDGVQTTGLELKVEYRTRMEALLGCFLAQFGVRLALWIEQGFTPFVKQFNDCLAWKGKHVGIERVDGTRLDSGVITAVTERGTLLLANPDENPDENSDKNPDEEDSGQNLSQNNACLYRANFQEVASGEVHFLPPGN